MKSRAQASGLPDGARRLLLALAIVAAAFLAYLPSLPGDFIWDDDAHVTHNRTLRDVEGLRDIWIPSFSPRYEPHTPQYYPLAFTALWLQYQAFGLEPFGYRLVNLALHAANALLVWALFARLRMRGAWLLGGLFALHPMHVETVAWVMEIKNLLSAFFYLLAAIAYLRFDERWSAAREVAGRFPAREYSLALALFLGALLSKSVTCTLPPALALALLFRRERLDLRRLAPLGPMLVLGVALALNTAWLERVHVGAQGVEFDLSLADRLLVATRALLFYPFKMLAAWPLLFCYPRWEIDPSSLAAWWSVLAVLLLAGLALLAYARGRRGPPLAAAYYAGTIFPALGLVTYYPMLFSFAADHFNYLASLGILALIAAAVAHGIGDARPRAFVSVLLLGTFGGLTAAQSGNFASAEALYRHTLAHNPDAWFVRSQLAQLLLPGGQPWKPESWEPATPRELREAEELLRGAIALKEDHPMPHYNLALTLFHAQRPAEALPHALRAAELLPLDPESRAIAAVVALFAQDRETAERMAHEALERDPENHKALLVLADCRLAAGRGAEARELAARALASAPNATAAREAAQKIVQSLSDTTPAEALRFLDALPPSRFAAPFELRLVRAQALAALTRYDEALGLLRELALEAEALAQAELAAALRRHLAELEARAAAPN